MTRTKWCGMLVVLALLMVTPIFARGQVAPPSVSGTGGNVSIVVDQADICAALKQLFQQAKISYVIDPDVHSRPLSMAFYSVPFQVALERLMTVSEEPLRYTVENGIYTIQPGGTLIDHADLNSWKVGIIRPSHATAEALCAFLKELPSECWYQITVRFTAIPESNILLVTYPDTPEGDAIFREAQLRVRLVDVTPRKIELPLRIEYAFVGNAGKDHQPLLSLVARTANANMAHIKFNSGGGSAVGTQIVIDACRLDMSIKPTINGDSTVNMDVQGSLDLTYRLPGESRSRHLLTAISYVGQHHFGDTVVLSSVRVDTQQNKTAPRDIEVRILVTPH